MGTRRLLVLGVLVVFPWGLASQGPAGRAAVGGLRDSLVGVRDTIALRALETSVIERAKADRNNAALHLRLGFIAYRLGELTGVKDRYDDAAGEFEWAAELQPDWPYAWYGLGLAELALGEHSAIAIENLRQQLGKDYLSKAARAFARATQADPAFGRAAVDLANTALVQRIHPRLAVALEAVRLAAAAVGDQPDVQLARGRVERELDHPDSAAVAFRAYLAVGGDSALGLLELARTEFQRGRRTDGVDAYFAGAGMPWSAEAAMLYRRDLSWVANPDELAAFDSLGAPAARRAWLTRFWEQRDWEQAWAPGERLAEHYRRWFYARRTFRLVSRHRHYDITEVYRSAQAEFDDRGVVYLRHGPPDQRAEYSRAGVEPNVSWLYHRPGGDLIFHFVARDDVQDFRLVESLADVLGFGRAVRAQGATDPALADLYASRLAFGPVYQRVAARPSGAGRVLAEERAEGRRNIGVGTHGDSYEHRFAARLPVVLSDFVTGTGAGARFPQQVHVVFAIPASHLTGRRAERHMRYPLHFRLVVADATGRPVGQLDTLRVFQTAEALSAASYLSGRLTVAVPAGELRYRLLVDALSDGSGALLARDSLHVPALDGRDFALSDLVVGREESGLRWLTPSDTVALNPLSVFPSGTALELYYEVYGLAAGRSYRTVVRLEKQGGGSVFSAIGRLFGGRRSPVRLAFDAVADGPVMRLHRSIELRDTSRGTYHITVSLTDATSGRTLSRFATFEVVSGR